MCHGAAPAWKRGIVGQGLPVQTASAACIGYTRHMHNTPHYFAFPSSVPGAHHG